MTTGKLVRRALLAAAVSTAGVVSTTGSGVFGLETSSKMASGIYTAQNQPGQSSPPPNGSVSQELNRMFEESGQPMPSMRAQDLPNAQGQQSGMVRPKPQAGQTKSGQMQPGQPGQLVQQKSQPAKKNFLQKFMGKFSGQDKKQAEANVVPPVPPGYREAVPTPASTTNVVQKSVQNQNGRPTVSSSGQVRTATGTAQTGGGGIAVNQGDPKSANNAGGQSRRVSQPVPPVPGIPAGRGVAKNANGNSTGQAVSSDMNAATAQPRKYTQPGTAPAFMPAQPAKRTPTVTVAKPSVSAPPVQQAKPASVPVEDDGFVDPFADSAVAGAIDLDSLDLDLIAQQPVVADSVSDSVADERAESAETADAIVPAPDPAVAEVQKRAPETAADAAAATNDETTSVSETNPFTGVTLNASAEAIFGKEPTPATVETSSVEPTPANADSEFAGPAHPLEEFDPNLPAINLPPVEYADVQSSEVAANAAALNVPDLDTDDTSATVTAGTLEQTPTIPESAATTDSSSSAAPQIAGRSELVETPLQNVDAERLQQAVEQERRLRQQRLILSRSGQTGFKGFCPVALRDRRDLEDSSAEFTATFGLQTYAFATLAAKTAFEAEPSRYAPAAGGSDVVLLVNSGEEQPGMLDYALWHRDRLYLFRSRETLALFAQDPQRFASQY